MHYFRNLWRKRISLLLGLLVVSVVWFIPQGIMAVELIPSEKIEIGGIIEVEAQSIRKKFITHMSQNMMIIYIYLINRKSI